MILTFALVIRLVVAFLGVPPIQLIFWANILVGVLAPILVIFIIVVGNNHRIMKNQRLSKLNNVFLLVTAVVLIVATLLFFLWISNWTGKLEVPSTAEKARSRARVCEEI